MFLSITRALQKSKNLPAKQKHERSLNLYNNRYRMNYGQRISVQICKMADSQKLVFQKLTTFHVICDKKREKILMNKHAHSSYESHKYVEEHIKISDRLIIWFSCNRARNMKKSRFEKIVFKVFRYTAQRVCICGQRSDL